MPIEELSLVRFCVMNYWAVLISSRPFQPISTLQVKLVQALINSEPEPDKEMMKKVEWIYQHTHKNVNFPLSTIEFVVFRNLDKGVNKEIEIGEKTFYLFELYNYLDEISKELSNFVIEVAKRYSIDMPVMNFKQSGTNQSINFD